jgi:hypothetical protein
MWPDAGAKVGGEGLKCSCAPVYEEICAGLRRKIWYFYVRVVGERISDRV